MKLLCNRALYNLRHECQVGDWTIVARVGCIEPDFLYQRRHNSVFLGLCRLLFVYRSLIKTQRNSPSAHLLLSANLGYTNGIIIIIIIIIIKNTLISLIIITRHSLVRAEGEVFVLLYVFCSLFLSTISRQPAVRFTPHFACGRSGVLWFRMCLLPFWGLAAPRGGWKRGKYRMRMAGLCQFYRHTCYYYYYLLLLLLLLLLLPLTWTMAVKTVYVPAEP